MPRDLDAIAQLVFFVLIILGWVVKAIVEARQEKQRRSAPPPVEPAPPRPPAQDRVFRPRTAPRPAPSTPAPAAGELGHLDAPRTAYAADPAVAASTPVRLLRSSAAAIAHGVRTRRDRRRRILGRLSGGLEVAPGRDLTRAGILWSEILGPCRAVRGPHRSPAAERGPPR